MNQHPTRYPLQWPIGWKRTQEGHVEIQLQAWAGVTLVDYEDALWLRNFSWYAHRQRGNVYVRTDVHNEGAKRSYLMHRLIMGAQQQQLVDHEHGNGLDNRRAHLRFATAAENAANGRRLGVHSAFKGVTRDTRRISKPWTAQITKNYHHQNIGSFDDEVVAAAAYDLMAQKLHGPFARLNFGTLCLVLDDCGNWVNAITHDPEFRLKAARDEALQEVR